MEGRTGCPYDLAIDESTYLRPSASPASCSACPQPFQRTRWRCTCENAQSLGNGIDLRVVREHSRRSQTSIHS